MRRAWVRAALVTAALAVAAAGCGDSDSAEPVDAQGQPPAGQGGPEEAEFPVTIEAANGAVTIDERPERIVSLSATATEMLYAIDAGDQVVAVDSTSNYPPEVPTTDLAAFEPNVEAIVGYDPDLVVASDDINGLVASLQALDVPVVLAPAAATLDDSYDQIVQLGVASGHPAEAAELVDDMQDDIAQLRAAVPLFDAPPTYYHELDQTFFSVTSQTFIGEIYGLVGLQNIADEAADAASGYPQLSAEFIVAADPDLVFLADTKCCGITADTVAERPGWDQLTAVRNGDVVELDDDIASRWGPRVVDLLETISAEVSELGDG
jgi:iron complex transport system substrate-binding protein